MPTPQANALHTQIGEIQDRRTAADKARQGDKAYMQLRQAQSMASMVARKKEEFNSKLERLQVRYGGRGAVQNVEVRDVVQHRLVM